MKEAIVCTLGGLIAPFVVAYCTLTGTKYPDWTVTPDDIHSPYGQYEPTTRKVYERFGKRVGDFYWLGLRNRAYGLRYYFKPDELKGLTTYDHIKIARIDDNTVGMVLGDQYYEEKTRAFGPLRLISGWRLTPLLDTKLNQNPVRPINMDGRPVLTIRRATNT